MSAPSLILVTRPRIEALKLCKTLQKRGYHTLQFPLIRVSPLQQKREELHLPSQIQGWLFSSANGVLHCLRAFAYEPLFFHIWRHQPALAIGKATAEALSQKGFSNIIVANGINSDGLCELALQQFSTERGTILHPSGTTLTGNITGELQKQGFDARKLSLYQTIPANSFAPHILESFNNRIITHVTLFSTKTAQVFLDLARRANLDDLTTCTCLCLSQLIADTVSVLPWKEIKVAQEPSSEHIIKLLPPSLTSKTPVL